MKGRTWLVCGVAALGLAAAVGAQSGAGYLTTVPDTSKVLPAPPQPGSAAFQADHDAFVATRALADGPRWALAKRDADNSPKALLADYGCALGVKLDPADEPTLYRLADRMRADASAIIKNAKDQYKRLRPFVTDPRPICTPDDIEVQHSFSYPSGHSTRSWAYALILAEILPERATEIMARARVYGDSRVVCGVHYVSDVEAGRSNGAILVAALHANPAFAADLQAAKQEVAAALAAHRAAPDAASCAADLAVSQLP